ncbi:signal peptidase I [Vibrio coralliilyticus]|nr:signal peptidase I [Vibrio coralliilyticus]
MENVEALGGVKQHPLKLIVNMIWLGIAIFLGIHFLVTTFTKHYLFVYDGADKAQRCIPEYSVYLLKRDYGEVEIGKVYTFKAKNMAPFYPDGTLISKYVVGAEGDLVVQNEQGVFINGKQLVKDYPSRDKLEVDAESFYTAYSIPQGRYYVSAPAKRSYDSRYWGTVAESQIIGEAIPLW